MVRKITLACLSDWNNSELDRLRRLLEDRRKVAGNARCEVESIIFAMVCGNTPIGKQWRLLQNRPARRIQTRAS